MDRMWSPWRSSYVAEAADRDPPDGQSLFSALLQKETDRDTLILWRGEQVFVIMNRYPYNTGHLLIVPYHEVADYGKLDPSEQSAIAAAIDRCLGWLREALSPDGFNVGMNLGRAGGAGIPEHVHMHVLPRWDGDTNFMPVTGGTKVLSEDLGTTYDKLRDAMTKSERASTKHTAPTND